MHGNIALHDMVSQSTVECNGGAIVYGVAQASLAKPSLAYHRMAKNSTTLHGPGSYTQKDLRSMDEDLSRDDL